MSEQCKLLLHSLWILLSWLSRLFSLGVHDHFESYNHSLLPSAVFPEFWLPFGCGSLHRFTLVAGWILSDYNLAGPQFMSMENIIRNHFIKVFFFFGFGHSFFGPISNLWAVQPLVSGHLGIIRLGLYLLVWNLSWSSHWQALTSSMWTLIMTGNLVIRTNYVSKVLGLAWYPSSTRRSLSMLQKMSSSVSVFPIMRSLQLGQPYRF